MSRSNLTPVDLGPPATTSVLAALARAVAKLAPLWPLQHFVAVNPFVGLAQRPFEAAALDLARAAGARLTMPRGFYAEAHASDPSFADDLRAAIVELELELDADALLAALSTQPQQGGWDPARVRRATVADVAAHATGQDWPRQIVDAISSWAAGYFDAGQAAWASPWRDASPFAAWRAEAALDRGPELLGLSGFRALIAAVPSAADEAAAWAISQLGLADELDGYLHRLAMTVAGWIGYARYLGWAAPAGGEQDLATRELLVIRLVWDAVLLRAGDPRVAERWAAQRPRGDGRRGAEASPSDHPALAADLALQLAYERGAQRRLLGPLPARGADTRPINRFVQAVFCIDVRSEPMRRILEAMDPGIETRGFAGFFGVPIEYQRLGLDRSEPRCPVLVAPSLAVPETAPDDERERVAHGRRRRQQARDGVWASFKQAAVSSFTYVEAAGLGYAVKLVSDGLGLTRPVPHPAAHGLDRETAAELRPDPRAIDLPRRVELAAGMLRAMSLTGDFANLVVLFGHAASTVNNPHATGLDCGACGGHGGDANARVAAAILNDPEVRAALAERGLAIPAQTWFAAGLHDTTTDELKLFDVETIPTSHRWELQRLQTRMRAAAPLARAQRAPRLGLTGPDRERAVAARSRDWAELRPEWGLAGCAALIIAPRRRTRGLELGGRVFLHDYEWRRDPEFRVLETLMTAPMIVASWISLQYYGSAVDNQVFGAGDKRLHNVVGTLGVLEGRHGDLRVGLPLQSVHDGERLVHEPLRLSVVIDAPTDAINAVLDAHPEVRALVDHRWLHLFAMDERGAVGQRYAGGLRWEPYSADAPGRARPRLASAS